MSLLQYFLPLRHPQQLVLLLVGVTRHASSKEGTFRGQPEVAMPGLSCLCGGIWEAGLWRRGKENSLETLH